MRQEHDRRRYGLDALLMVGIGAFVLAWVPLLEHRFFDPDEFEHAHAAWSMSKGLVLYRDFFEHHTPWYYGLLRELLLRFDVETSFDSACRFFLAGRVVSVVVTVGSLALVVLLGRTWASRRVGSLAALLLVTQPFFFKKSIEIRPDVLALPFFLSSLWALLRGLAPQVSTAWRRRSWFALAGLLLGGAIMFTQKMLFVVPGVLAGLGLWILLDRKWARTADVVLFVIGVLLPGIATYAWYARVNAGEAFMFDNFLLNVRWKQNHTGQLIRLLGTSAPVVALAVYRAFSALPRLFKREQRDPGELLLWCVVIWLFLAVAVMPTPQMQYFLMPLPIVCLFAASALIELSNRVGRRFWPWALVALSILPIVNFAMNVSGSSKQLALLRRVFETTKPTDLVMDGWQGIGVFRPHALFYFFVDDDMLVMMSPERLNAFFDDLESGRVRPALIALDRRLAALGPRFRAFVNAHYSSSDGFFYYWAGG